MSSQLKDMNEAILQPPNRKAIQRLIPFDADDEPVGGQVDGSDPPKDSNELPHGSYNANENNLAKANAGSLLPDQRPAFVRKRPAQNRLDGNMSIENGL